MVFREPMLFHGTCSKDVVIREAVDMSVVETAEMAAKMAANYSVFPTKRLMPILRIIPITLLFRLYITSPLDQLLPHIDNAEQGNQQRARPVGLRQSLKPSSWRGVREDDSGDAL